MLCPVFYVFFVFLHNFSTVRDTDIRNIYGKSDYLFQKEAPDRFGQYGGGTERVRGGQSTFEKAECKMLSTVIDGAIKNAGLQRKDVDMIVSGDLLNQIISASFAARDFSIPFLGVYGACSTMAESLAVAAAFTDGGYRRRVVAATGSHFASAERQYRYPLELGTTRPPQSQWTVTGAGGALVACEGDGIRIAAATLGKVVDYGITDVNNMGAAMAPASGIMAP